jgi:hypothetical protein
VVTGAKISLPYPVSLHRLRCVIITAALHTQPSHIPGDTGIACRILSFYVVRELVTAHHEMINSQNDLSQNIEFIIALL